MTKLLHERMRDLNYEGGCAGNVLASVGYRVKTDCSLKCKDCIAQVMKTLADEIERDYIPRTEHEAEVKRIIEAQGDMHDGCGPSAHHIMKTYAEAREMSMENESITEWLDRWFIPRPRYEDGEPVQFGDEYEADRGTTQKLEQLHCFADGGYVLNRKGKRASVRPGEFVKRPSKVLDADGVETKVGDTVYLIDHYDEDLSEYHGALQVMEIRSIGCSADPFFVVANEEGIATDLGHELFTHERPVLDADGVPIRKGDTVWHITRGEKHTVEHVDGEDGGIFIEGCNSIFSGVEFTHREPDSLKKAVEDLGWLINYPMSDDEKLEKVDDLWRRLTALIERGA